MVTTIKQLHEELDISVDQLKLALATAKRWKNDCGNGFVYDRAEALQKIISYEEARAMRNMCMYTMNGKESYRQRAEHAIRLTEVAYKAYQEGKHDAV